MTLYLTPQTTPQIIRDAAKSEHVVAVKWYPAGATTHSEYGVSHIESSMDVLETLAEVQMPLLIHGEVTDPDTDTFDREQKFIDQVLDPLLQRLPELRVVLEHITTSQGADFVAECDADIAATITPQHLLLNRTALFQGGLRPHHYCLPILKRESHRQRLVQAAVSGHPRYFLGTDSAPHLQIAKESACGCAGIYSAHAGIELYAEVFDQENALDKLEQFASLNGPAFYRLPVNQERIELRRKDWLVPGHYSTPEGRLIPFRANQTIAWSLVSDE